MILDASDTGFASFEVITGNCIVHGMWMQEEELWWSTNNQMRPVVQRLYEARIGLGNLKLLQYCYLETERLSRNSEAIGRADYISRMTLPMMTGTSLLLYGICLNKFGTPEILFGLIRSLCKSICLIGVSGMMI